MLRTIAALAFALLLSAPCLGAYQAPKQSASTAHANEVANPRYGVSPEAPVFVRVLPIEPTAEENAKKAEDDKERAEKTKMDHGLLQETKRLADWTAALGVATGLLFVFTAGLFLIAVFQWRDSDRAIRSAEDSAAAAQQSVKIAEETAMRQLRAYVHVNPGECRLKFRGEQGYEVLAHLSMQNYGVTPAYKVRLAAMSTFHRFPLNSNDTFPAMDSTGGAQATVPPNESFNFKELCSTLSQAEFNEARNGGGALYLHGSVEYEDIYGDKHVTNFRILTRGQDLERRLFAWCTEGNDAT